MNHVSVSRPCTERRQRTTLAWMLLGAAGASSRSRAGRSSRWRTRADHGASVPYHASFLLGEGGFHGLLFGELVQKFNAVNIGRGGTPLTRGKGIDAQTDPRDHGHVCFVKIGGKRGAQVELLRHRFRRRRIPDTDKPAALVKISALVGGVGWFLLARKRPIKYGRAGISTCPLGWSVASADSAGKPVDLKVAAPPAATVAAFQLSRLSLHAS
jgi:hypothetical protein